MFGDLRHYANLEGSAYFLVGHPDDHKLEIHVGNWQARISLQKVPL